MTSRVQPQRSFHFGQQLWKGRRAYFNKHIKATDPVLQDHDYFDKQADLLPLDKDYLDNLKNLWTKKIGYERDLMMKASDNLIGRNNNDYALPHIDVTRPRLNYSNVDVLKNAPEQVKKIFSVDFGQRSDLSAAWKKELRDTVKLDAFDVSSLQSRIAWATACIRHWTALVDELQSRNPKKPVHLTTKIFLTLGYRRKLLRFLREQDQEAFEKILKDLQISFQMEKPPEHVKTRKAWSEHKLKQRVEAEKEERLSKLRVEFEKQRKVRIPEIEEELKKLDLEQNKVEARIQELQDLQGSNIQVQGKYEPQLIQELSEAVMHNQLLYFEKPSVQ